VLHGVAGTMTTVAVTALTGLIVVALVVPRPRGAARAGLVLSLTVMTLVGAGYLTEVSAPPVGTVQTTYWVQFDRASIARRVSRGETVFVDVTADWCLTCKANKALVLDREPVVSALAAKSIAAMRADWTRPDPAISRYLEGFGRYGIPFNAVYGPGAPGGIALPEILSSNIVMDALAKAAVSQSAKK